MAYLAVNFFTCLSPLFKTIITWLTSAIGNYGWTIVLFTVMLKIVTIPIDIWQKASMKKNQIVQFEMAPDLAKINARYGTNKSELNKKQMECYKKHGFSPVGGCLPLIINMLLVVIIYGSMLSAVNGVSAKISYDQYKTFEAEYNLAIEQGKTKEQAQEAVVIKYKNDKSTHNGFLWIKNIAQKDGANAVFEKKENFTKNIKGYLKLSDAEINLVNDNYDNVMGGLTTKYDNWNGYYILLVLIIGTSFLSTFITSWQEKKRNGGIAMQQGNILTKLLMPAILGILCFTQQATFGIYLLANSIITILVGFAIDPFVNMIMQKFIRKKAEKVKPKIDYSR